MAKKPVNERFSVNGLPSVLHQSQDDLTLTLVFRAERSPDAASFVMLDESLEPRRVISYGALLGQASRLAARLIESCPGQLESALIVCKSEEDFIRATYACLLAGVTAVPCSLPTSRKSRAERLRSILAASGAKLVICDQPVVAKEMEALTVDGEQAVQVLLLTPDESVVVELDRNLPGLRGDPQRAAFIQFTSGSTSASRGAVVGHANVMANLRTMAAALPLCEGDSSVNWCPLYHDMGLIGNVFLAVALGVTNHMLSPLAFLQRPVRWLQAIGRYRARASGGPNFAYEECVTRVAEEDLAKLDLGTWEFALNGAEPVRAATLERFCQRFGHVGFSPRAFLPCYGLAENTLWVTGRRAGEGAEHLSFDARVLARQRRLELASGSAESLAMVSCGPPGAGVMVRVVDPQHGREVEDGSVGEIWVSGDSVAQGYWQQPEATRQAFEAELAGSARRWLRTGDLGAIWAGELVVCGRLKELLIVRGRNYYPVDVEQAAQDADARFLRGAGVAFSFGQEGTERVCLVQEMTRDASRQSLDEQGVSRVVAAVLARTGVRIDQLVTVRPGTLPRTTSGKLQRTQVRGMYELGDLLPAPALKDPTTDLKEMYA